MNYFTKNYLNLQKNTLFYTTVEYYKLVILTILVVPVLNYFLHRQQGKICDSFLFLSSSSSFFLFFFFNRSKARPRQLWTTLSPRLCMYVCVRACVCVCVRDRYADFRPNVQAHPVSYLLKYRSMW